MVHSNKLIKHSTCLESHLSLHSQSRRMHRQAHTNHKMQFHALIKRSTTLESHLSHLCQSRQVHWQAHTNHVMQFHAFIKCLLI